MKKIGAFIIQPTIIALGSSIFLYSYNDKLRYVDYFIHVPFWIGIVRPSGLLWNQKFLKQINKEVFPSQMKVYRQLYLTNKNAILYDIIFNHTIYHSLLTPILITYLYIANNLIKGTKLDQRKNTKLQNKQENQSLLSVLKGSALNLVQGRVLISCFSILSEYLISYVSLKQQIVKGSTSIPTPVKKFLLAKEMLLNWSWTGLVLKQFYKNYWFWNEQQNKQIKQQQNL